jgi:predicted HTH transcriptional regulator
MNDETKDHMIGWTSVTVSGWNLLNVDETMAEREEKMAETMSETTYQTIQELQNVLRTMIDTYNADCCPNQ